VTVYKCDDALHGETLASILRDNGVNARLLGTRHAALIGVAPHTVQLRIEVPFSEEEKARELIDNGELGPLMFLRARYGHGGRTGYDREWRSDINLSGGGELIDQGVHLIDLARWFLGDFATVDGHATTSFWDMKVDDNAFLSLRTAKGQTAWLHASCTEWKNLFSFEIYGRNAKIAIDGLGGSYGVERLSLYRMLPEMGPPETTIFEYPRGDQSWATELEAFIADIHLRRQPEPGIPDGIRTLEIVEQIYRSSGFPVSDTGL
jgi:predicted dehydrogenase